MPEFKLDIVAVTDGFVNGLENGLKGLQELGDKAVQTNKETQKAFEQNGGVEKFGKSLKDQFIFLGKTEIEIRKIKAALKSTFDPKEVAGLNAQLKTVTDSTIRFNNELDKTETTAKSLRAQLRENKAALAEMEEQGLDTTESFTQLQIATGKLQDQINDTNERIKFFASDTKGLDGTIALAKTAAAGFAVAEGTAALFGAENENVQKALLKVNAAMAILNGLQEIQAALQKSSAARIVIETALQKVKIFFIGAETVATEGLTVAQLQAANAAKILRIALISTGILAIVGLLALAANAMGAFGDSIEETNDKLEKQKERIADLANKYKELDNAALERIQSETDLEKARLKLAGATDDELIQKDIDFLNRKKGFLKQQFIDLTGNTEAQKQVLNELSILRNDIALKEVEIEQAKSDKIKEVNDKEVEDRKAYYAKIQAIVDGNNANRIAALNEGYEKERAQLEENQRKELVAAQKQGLDLNLLYAKFNKERIDLDQKFIAIGRQNSDKAIAEEEARRKEEQEFIIETKLDYIDNLEKIQLLELDIEYESGNKSIVEARRIAEAKLKIEIEAAEKRIALLKASGGDLSQIRQLELAVAQGKSALADLAKEGDNSDFLKAIGLGDITEQELQDIKSNLAVITDSVKSIFSDMIGSAIDSNSQLITQLDKQIEIVKDNIEKQAELGNEGRENNLAQERRALGRLEAERRDAFEKDKKLQKQKLNLDAVTQVSSLITASANIFQATSTAGPVGVAAAIAAIAVMFASFISSQVQARKAIDKQTFKRGGLIGGKLHDTDGYGGNRYVSDNGDETYIERGEYVVNRKASQKHFALIDALNHDRIPDYQKLLANTGVRFNSESIEKFKALKQSHANAEIKVSRDSQWASEKETKQLREDFNKFAARIENKTEVVISGGYRFETRGNRTIRTKLKNGS